MEALPQRERSPKAAGTVTTRADAATEGDGFILSNKRVGEGPVSDVSEMGGHFPLIVCNREPFNDENDSTSVWCCLEG